MRRQYIRQTFCVYDGLIPQLSSGDVIMANKDFTIEDSMPLDIGLNVPPRLSTKHQMSASEFFQTANIATTRIVLENGASEKLFLNFFFISLRSTSSRTNS